jgi:hypothetical protein
LKVSLHEPWETLPINTKKFHTKKEICVEFDLDPDYWHYGLGWGEESAWIFTLSFAGVLEKKLMHRIRESFNKTVHKQLFTEVILLRCLWFFIGEE